MNSAVIAAWLQSTRGQIILCWGTVVDSMSKFFTTIKFHDECFTWNYHLGIVVHSG